MKHLWGAWMASRPGSVWLDHATADDTRALCDAMRQFPPTIVVQPQRPSDRGDEELCRLVSQKLRECGVETLDQPQDIRDRQSRNDLAEKQGELSRAAARTRSDNVLKSEDADFTLTVTFRPQTEPPNQNHGRDVHKVTVSCPCILRWNSPLAAATESSWDISPVVMSHDFTKEEAIEKVREPVAQSIAIQAAAKAAQQWIEIARQRKPTLIEIREASEHVVQAIPKEGGSIPSDSRLTVTVSERDADGSFVVLEVESKGVDGLTDCHQAIREFIDQHNYGDVERESLGLFRVRGKQDSHIWIWIVIGVSVIGGVALLWRVMRVTDSSRTSNALR